ncbi:MAG: zf-HC2 domain-containing protein [Planctomycetes bacterium]|nr:zf-HC2 domain-containing protein [Planctomycetota bacterium]
MNDANTAFGPEACAERREDIALYAAGTLPLAEAQQLEAHFEMHPACRELLEAHRRVLKLVHEESLPGDAVDQAKVLRELKRRMAVESRVSLVPAQAALSRRGRIVWFVAILVVVLGIGAGIAVSTYTPPDGPVGPEGPIGPKPVATYYAPSSAQGKPVAAGDSIEAKGGIVRIVFTGGAEARLRDGSAARITGAKDMELLAGEAAVNVPASRSGFTASAGQAKVEVPDTPGSRFLLSLNQDSRWVVVAEGQVVVRGRSGQVIEVYSGASVDLNAAGDVAPTGTVSLPDTFAWVMEGRAKNLHCLMEAKGAEQGRVHRLVAAIENAGEETILVARYYPLGVNYQLQTLTQDQMQAGFSRLSPVEVRKRKKDGSIETVRPISGTLDLEPGDRYELELDASALPPATTSAVLHYLSFGEEGGGWGFALKSEPLKLSEPAPEEKTPPKDGAAKTH